MRERFTVTPGQGPELPPVTLPSVEPQRDPLVDTTNPRHRALLERLGAGYLAATTTEGFQRYIDVVSKLSTYSPRNVGLIFAQNPEASMVASFATWKDLGRHVLARPKAIPKGEYGIKIFYPFEQWITEVDEQTGQECRRKIITGFGIGNVYDISQTEGAPIPEPPAPSERFGTTEVAKLLDRKASLWGIGQGLRLEKTNTFSARGTFNPETRTLRLSRDLPDDDGKLKTLVHELAHFAAGHQQGWQDKARKEVEAEGTAFATLLALGLDTSNYSVNYMALHGRTPEIMRQAMPVIAATTRVLVSAIEGEQPDGEAEWL